MTLAKKRMTYANKLIAERVKTGMSKTKIRQTMRKAHKEARAKYKK